MSWVHHHKKPPPPSSSSSLSSSFHSLQPSININSTINSNSQQQQLQNRNPPSVLRQATSSVSQPLTASSPLLMTSQYSNKTTTNSSLKSTITTPTAVSTTMHLNQSPYQPMTQQQSQQQHQQQQQHVQSLTPQQRHQQHVLQTTSSQPPPPPQTPTPTLNSTSQLQGVFNTNQQQNSWPTQSQNFLPSSKMMQPTPPPPAASAQTAAMNNNNNNWPQQPLQQNYQNANMYPQQNTNLQQQQWPQQNIQQQQQQQQPPSTTYDNSYYQQHANANNNNMYQQQPPPPSQHVAQQNPATYFQQQQHVVQNQAPPANTNPVNFFDNSNNNQSSGDGWGDWDWNDNSAIAPPPEQKVANEPQMTTQQQQHVANDNLQHQQQHGQFNTSVIADSFSNPTNNNNDNWSWGAQGNEQQQQPQQVASANKTEPQKLDNNVKPQNDNWNWSSGGNDQQQQQPPPPQIPDVNVPNNDNWNWQASNETQQQIAATQNVTDVNASKVAPPKTLENLNAIENPNQIASPPPPPPPTEFSSSTAASENHNYNTNAVSSPSNIPNTVFVTQAKPVSLPARQFASPPSGNTPVSENPPETTLMPPQGFQNVEESITRPANVVSPAIPPPAIPPPTAGLPPTATANPFKRSGVAQHHRATGLMTTTSTTASAASPAIPVVFNMPPPPPADFANPGSVTLMEPENNELPSQENQEVLSPPPTSNITLPNTNVVMTAPPSNISLPNATTSTQPPPPNDERNQYLQTSHLSENSEEQQPEADGLLPPPGLSRLVLGEPELEASQQRMVMGTEASTVNNTANQAAAMHLEERHADGEDTASENAVPILNNSGSGVPPSSSTLSSDRNLYLVPGESNNNNVNTNQPQQQRVVTGVELAEQREIEMDGENLEDEQIQQQQQQHQQQLQQQQQLQHQSLSAEGRNEPPVEGADEIIEQPTLASSGFNHPTDQHVEQHHHNANNQTIKTKDSHTISSPNDDDDSDERLLNDRAMTQSTAGSSKSRSKYENDRIAAASSRRREKRSSVQRYESDEYLNSEGEYSSDREERERRERDRRRNYREGSVRSERGGPVDEDEKRSRRNRNSDKRDKYYYEGEERNRGERGGERERGGDQQQRSKNDRRSQRQRGYDMDSRYETEESTRFDNRKDPARRSMRHPEADRNRRGDRSDQGADYDDYNRRGYRSSKRSGENYEADRRDRRRSDKLRDPRYRDDPRYDPREFEDYRKHSSRNARESDYEKDGAGPAGRAGRMPHDPRQTAAAAMYGYPSGGYYDPYTAYYYQQMARNNPQAYAEWYKKYYGSTAAHAAGVAQGTGMQGAPNAAHADASLSNAVNDGRESVHSGRSSAHNDMKDRYTHAYITQANDYHRHYQQQQQQQQHHHHQQQQQQHHQQMAFNQSLNSTMLDEDSLNNHNNSLYGGVIGGVLSSARSNTNLSQIHGGYYMMPTSGTITSAASVYYARSDYAESRSGAISMRDPDPIANEPQRLTPCKFINEHAVVSFSSGVLVTVKPKYTPNGSISNVVKLLKFKPNDETRKLFKVFPGPLVRGLTHKKTVIEFCHEQIRLGPMETTIYAKQLITNNADRYRGSYTLMWNLLILLLKQNGMVVGTDIAELLLKNEQQFPYQTPNSSLNNSLKSKSGSNSPAEELQDSQKDSHDTAADTHNKSDNSDNAVVAEDKEKLDDDDNEDNSLTKSSSVSSPLTEDEITEKFRNYLLYGNVNEALEWATDNNLWGHALFLASKLDRRSHANVMMKFANKLSLNDPLQTLYQLMSGRTPSSVTCIQDEKWGDWRPHLSMILSNTSQKPELDRKSITTLGDSLFNRGDLYAAHFCYLMAQVSFGRYQETATLESTLQQHLPKLVLLGSSHYKQFQDFSHNEAIIMTEIYEYARSLNDDKFSIVEFQPYKFLLASRLLDYGFHLKSLMYLEQIAVHIARDSSKYESSFINKVYDMADRLKYYDPVLEKTIDDQQQLPGSEDINGSNSPFQQMEEQKWLQNLRELAQQYKTELSSSITAATSTNSIQDAQQQQQQQTIDPNYNYQQQQIDQQFMEINKQFSELNLQYQPQNTGNEQPVFYNTEQQHQQQQQPTITHTVEDQPQSLDPYHLNQQQQQPQQSLQPELPITNAKDLQQPELLQPQPPPPSMSDANQDTYQQQYLQPDMQQQQSGYTQNYYDPSQQQQQQQYNAVDGSSGGIDSQQQPASYDYWGQQQQQHMPQLGEENARPTISMPKSKTYDTDDDGKQQLGNDAKKQQQQQSQQKGAKKEDKDANKGSLQQSNQNSGWFGGIWNKFSLKPKNQMILPDDKNPSIVWDPEKKKWVNVDGEEAEQESFKPPPKMSDIMPQPPVQPQIPNVGQISLQQQQQQQPQPTNQIPFMDPQQMPQQQQQQQYVPSSMPTSAPSPNPMQQQPQQQPQNQPQQAAATAKTPNLQSNMFKMQRNRTLKNAYVDVFNPSGAPVNKAAEGILAPALPPAAVPQGGFFVPGGGQEQQYQQQPQQQQSQQQDTPHFYNPNQFTAGSGY